MGVRVAYSVGLGTNVVGGVRGPTPASSGAPERSRSMRRSARRAHGGSPVVPVGRGQRRRIEVDIPTLIALSTVAWALADVFHEVVGHGGAAVLLGVPVRAASTTTLYLAWDQMQTVGDVRTVDAAGTVLNLVTGVLALLALRSRRVTSAASRYFLWLFATFSFVVVTLNLLVGGDWSEITTGLEPRGLWKALIFAAGMLVAVVGYVLPLRLWMPDLRGNRRLQLKITAIPVAVLIAD